MTLALILLNIASLLPILIPIFTRLLPRVLPTLVPKLAALFGAIGVGGSAVAKGGFFAAVVAILAKIWGFLSRFPGFIKGLFAVGGKLYFIRWALFAIVTFAKHPFGLFAILFLSSFFPLLIEKLFLVVGAVALRIFLTIFKIGKAAFLGAAGPGTGGAIDQFREAILGSFDDLPVCMVQVMGYIHFIEDLGIIVSTVTLLVVVSVFRVVYGNFITK